MAESGVRIKTEEYRMSNLEVIAVRGNWLQAACRKLQALMGAYIRLPAFNEIKEEEKI